MKVLTPGHRYRLAHLDGDGETILEFVKREGPGYPGNVGTHEGTTMQEALRALVDRALYVQRQIPCAETALAIDAMKQAIHAMEIRAARRHERAGTFSVDDAVFGPTCSCCGHIQTDVSHHHHGAGSGTPTTAGV